MPTAQRYRALRAAWRGRGRSGWQRELRDLVSAAHARIPARHPARRARRRAAQSPLARQPDLHGRPRGRDRRLPRDLRRRRRHRAGAAARRRRRPQPGLALRGRDGRLPPHAPHPLPGVRPPGRRLLRALPGVLRHHDHRAVPRGVWLLPARWSTAGTDMVVAEQSIRYRAPALFDDLVDVDVTIDRLGDTSMLSTYTDQPRRRAARRGRLPPRVHRGGDPRRSARSRRTSAPRSPGTPPAMARSPDLRRPAARASRCTTTSGSRSTACCVGGAQGAVADPADRRLAVEVDDHSSWGRFEGRIGSLRQGAIIGWHRGTRCRSAPRAHAAARINHARPRGGRPRRVPAGLGELVDQGAVVRPAVGARPWGDQPVGETGGEQLHDVGDARAGAGHGPHRSPTVSGRPRRAKAWRRIGSPWRGGDRAGGRTCGPFRQRGAGPPARGAATAQFRRPELAGAGAELARRRRRPRAGAARRQPWQCER